MQFTFLKNTFCGVALAFSLGTVLSSCTKDGNVGPKGAPGEAGPAGDKGQTGSLYFKNGFISGTITGTGKDGVTPIQETFRYEYLASNAPYVFKANGNQYFFSLSRIDSLNRGNAFLSFSAPADLSSVAFSAARIEYYKKITDGQYKQLSGSLTLGQFTTTPPGSITDYQYDEASGVLSGSYSWYTDNQSVNNETDQYSSTSSTGQPFTVKGTFSFVVRKGIY